MIFSRIHCNCFANFLWTYCLLRDFSLNSLSFLENYFEFAMKSLWNDFEITFSFATSLGIHHTFREFTISFANLPWIHDLLWIHYLLRDFTMNSLSFREFTLNPFFHYEFTICFAISKWIYYIFREFTLNTLSVSLIFYELTILQ